MDAGEAAVPCLIRKITDTTNIPDPGETMKFPETTVGDVAYFLLIDITKLGFVEFMPRRVQTDYKNNGVWAYYAYVAKKGHRKDLQNKLYECTVRIWERRSCPAMTISKTSITTYDSLNQFLTAQEIRRTRRCHRATTVLD